MSGGSSSLQGSFTYQIYQKLCRYFPQSCGLCFRIDAQEQHNLLPSTKAHPKRPTAQPLPVSSRHRAELSSEAWQHKANHTAAQPSAWGASEHCLPTAQRCAFHHKLAPSSTLLQDNVNVSAPKLCRAQH